MALTEAQLSTVNGIEPKGFHLNSGNPCDCGPEEYTTRKDVGYSDFGTYHHRCGDCENEFSTYIEG